MDEPIALDINQISSSGSHDNYSIDNIVLSSISPSLTCLKECLIKSVQIKYSVSEAAAERVQPRQAYVSHDRHVKITADRLAERFGIGQAKAKATLLATTQRGVRSAILTTISNRKIFWRPYDER